MATMLPEQAHFVYPSDLEYRITTSAVMTTGWDASTPVPNPVYAKDIGK